MSFFESADSPATVGLVIDSSVSMQRRRESAIAAGIAFAESSRPDDEMFTVHFNEKVWSGLPAGQMFTSDREELRHSLLRSTARGQTALFDALRLALTTLEQGHRQKRYCSSSAMAATMQAGRRSTTRLRWRCGWMRSFIRSACTISTG